MSKHTFQPDNESISESAAESNEMATALLNETDAFIKNRKLSLKGSKNFISQRNLTREELAHFFLSNREAILKSPYLNEEMFSFLKSESATALCNQYGKNLASLKKKRTSKSSASKKRSKIYI